MLQRNESTADRVVRALVGGALLWAGLGRRRMRRVSLLGIVIAAIGLVGLLTAGTGTCGVYRLLGISTYRR